MGNSKIARFVYTLLFAAVIHFVAGAPVAWGQSEHTRKLMDGARKEGRLVWYTSTNVADSKPLLDEFEKLYPFIKTELFRASGEKILNRVLTETRAGRWEFDVTALSEIGAFVEQNLIGAYMSPEAKAYIPDFKDPQGLWTAVYLNYYVIGYNTNLVSENDAPKDWPDLLDPKWKGKISIDQEEYPWYATLVKAWGKEKTQNYMAALAKQNIRWNKGHTLIAQLMAAGEYPVAIVYAHRTESLKKKGAPLEWVHTLNPVVTSVNSVGMAAKPKNPNAAKLFIDYILSKPGQEKIRTFSRIPARADIDPISPKMDQSKLKIKVVPDDTAERYKEYIHDFRRIFGL